jgi:hypothetical protein
MSIDSEAFDNDHSEYADDDESRAYNESRLDDDSSIQDSELYDEYSE